MAPRKRKAASIDTTPLTRSKRLASLRSARPDLQDLDSRRKHFETVSRHYVDFFSSAPPRRRRFPSFAAQSSTDPSPPSDPSPKPASTASVSPTSQPDSRPVISAATLDAVLSLVDSPSEAQNEMQRLLETLKAIPNAADDDMESVGERVRLHEDDDLESFCQTLATEPFLRSESAHIRLLGLCCLAEVFRIRAPNPPLDNRDMVPVCSAIFEELCVMASPNDSMDSTRFSLLEQLVSVKTLVIVSDFNHIVCDMFACFYALVRAHQSVKVRQYFADILVSVLEEMESPGVDVLDAALAPLVPCLGYTALSVSLAESVIQRAARHIQVPLVQLMNSSIRALRLEPSGTGGQKRPTYRRRSPLKKWPTGAEETAHLSQHHAHITDVIIKLNHLAPDVLIFVLPNLQDSCLSKDADVRLAAVDLLARLFTSREEMVESYPALFTEFLQRVTDIETRVREMVVNSLGPLLLLCPKQRGVIDHLLQERTFDLKETVRVAAVRSIGKVFDVVTDKTLERMFSRVQDKAESVRSEALQQIVSFYMIPQRQSRTDSKNSAETKLSLDVGQLRSAPSSSSVADDVQKEGDMEDAVIKRMLRITSLPDQLVEAYVSLRNTREYRSALEVERAIFEKICLPPTKKEKGVIGRGLRRMALFLAQLSPAKLSSFTAMSKERALARRELCKVCKLRLEPRNSSNGPDRARRSAGDRNADSEQNGQVDGVPRSRWNIEEARKASKDLAHCLESSPGLVNDIQEQCLQLATAVDLKVFERLLTSIDCSSTDTSAAEAAADAIARLRSKSPTGKFCASVVIPRCRPFIFSSSVLQMVCRHATDIATEGREVAIKRVKQENVRGSSSGAGPSQRNASFGGSKSTIEITPMVLVGFVRYLEMIGPQYQDALISATTGIKRLMTIPVSAEDWSAEVVLAGLRLGCNVPKGFFHHMDDARLASALRNIILCQKFKRLQFSSLMVKRATQLIISMWEDECSKVINSQDLLSELTSRLDSFNGNVEHLIGPLTSFCQFAKRTPNTYKAIALRSFDFARALLNGAMNSMICERFLEADSNETGSRYSEISDVSSQDIARRLGRGEVETLYNGIDNDFRLSIAEVVSRASKLLVYGLHHVDHTEEISNVAATFTGILGERRGDVFGITHVSTSKGGDSDSDNEVVNNDVSLSTVSNAVMCACNRLSMGRAILYLARKEEFFASVSPEKMVTTVLVGQDEHPLVRLSFARCVQMDVTRKRLPIRWTVAMALMAVDPVSGNVAKVKSMLTHIFQYRRKICEIAAQMRKAYTSQFLPESTLADLIWTLSNLPDVEMEQGSGYPESTKCIEFLIDCLCESKEYATVLNEFIASACIAEDATEPLHGGERTMRLRDMCRIASTVLGKRFLGRKLDLEHTRRVELPHDLYRIVPDRQAGSSNALRPKLLDVAIKYDEQRGIKRTDGPHALHTADGTPDAAESGTRRTSQRFKDKNVADDATDGNHGSRRRRGNAKASSKKNSIPEIDESVSSRMDEAATVLLNGTADEHADDKDVNVEEEITAVATASTKRPRQRAEGKGAVHAEANVAGRNLTRAKRQKHTEIGNSENNVDDNAITVAVTTNKRRTRQRAVDPDEIAAGENIENENGNVKRQKPNHKKARAAGGATITKSPATNKKVVASGTQSQRSGIVLRSSARKRIQKGDASIGKH